MIRATIACLTLAALLPLAVAPPGVLAQAQEIPSQWTYEWPTTDFSKLAVAPDEILSGGPPKDGIPAITDPVMIDAKVEREIGSREPVMVYAPDGAPARAYPLRYLMWHEIVNDTVGDVPVAVTFCPLCNSGLVFDRRLDGQVLEFGVTGKLRNSDMIMFDRQTESWWQQFSGEAIVGQLTGKALKALPTLMLSWENYRAEHPDGLVMAAPSDANQRYGTNPYVNYDTGRPFLYNGEMPPFGIPPNARVVRVEDRAWPLTRVAQAGEIVEDGLRISWAEGQASALDARTIAEGRQVGDIRVTDAATGAPVVFEVVFAFAFHAFHPDGTWKTGN